MDEDAFRVSQYAFRDLENADFKNKNYQYVVRKQFEDIFNLKKGNRIFIKDAKKMNVLVDEKKILLKLTKVNFDIIIDLNSTFHLGIARLVSYLNAEMKVGFVSKFSDRFYNMQLDLSKSKVMEKGFKQINMLLS